MPTPHNSAQVDQIAKTVLMPGDPRRAKFIADNFLENAELVNDVRGIGGYTGTYQGKPVTVMASGMGIPSIGIYSYELFKFYDVEEIIRIGSTGAYVEECKIFDIVLASSAYSESTFAKCLYGFEGDTQEPNAELNAKLKKSAEQLGIAIHEGVVHSADAFYRESTDYMDYVVNTKKCLCAEMESFGLFSVANDLGKKAACLLTVSDSLVTHEETTHEEREKKLIDMVKIALNTLLIED